MSSRLFYNKEEENINKESINNYKYLFAQYENNIPTLEEALIQLFKSEKYEKFVDDAKANYLAFDIINQCKRKINPIFNIIKQKYKNISINDAYIICSYTCESIEEDYSPYRLLNKNLVLSDRQHGIKNISKYLYIFLKSLRKLDRYYPTQTNKYLYRCIKHKVSLSKDPFNNKLIPYAIGNIKTFWAFTSTSTNALLTTKFLGKKKNEQLKMGTIFTLTGDVWGYDITLFNRYDEEEILLEPETKFKVDNVFPPVNDVIHITCRILKSPMVLSSNGVEQIINNNFIAQMKIEVQNNNGTNIINPMGYLCNIGNKNIKILITYYKKLNLECLNNITKFIVYINNEEREIDMKLDRYIYTNQQLDITMIEILEEDNISTFLEIDSNIASKNYTNENIEAIYLNDSNLLGKMKGTVIKKNYDNYICNMKSLNNGIILNNKSQLIGIIKEKNNNNNLIEFIPMNIIINKINYIKCIYDIKREDLGKNIQILNNKEFSHDDQVQNHEIINKTDIIINGKISTNILTYQFQRDGLNIIYFSSNELFTNTSYMFSDCSALKEVDISSFDTSEVTDMSYMFSHCSSLKEINLSSINTNKVTDMSSMFSDCPSLTKLNLTLFNTENVTDMSSMFSNCSSLKEINLTSFNTRRVTNMNRMFSYCSSLTNLNLSSFNTSRVAYMSWMFFNCSSLKELNLSSSFTANQVNEMNDIFSGCSSLKELNCLDTKLQKKFNGDECCFCII